MSKENMTIDEVKEMVCAIMELNREGGDFLYSPNVSCYINQSPIVSCFVKHKRTGETGSAQNFKGNMMSEIEKVKERLALNAESYVAQRKRELKKELAKLEELI